MRRLQFAFANKFGVPTCWRAATRVEQTQVVPNLSCRRDDRSRAMTTRALLNRNSRRQPFNRFDIGLLQLIEELPRIRAQRLHVLALTFRKDRVERQRTLSAAGNSRDDDELVSRQRDIDVLEIVLSRASDANRLLGRGSECRKRFLL